MTTHIHDADTTYDGYDSDCAACTKPEAGPDPDVTECPDCGKRGRYDGRVLVGGRGVYRCPCGAAWQDLDEKPTNKGMPIRGTS